jgi:hypothetical protein
LDGSIPSPFRGPRRSADEQQADDDAAEHGVLGMAIHASRSSCRFNDIDFSHGDELIEAAYREACLALDNPRRSRPAPAWPRRVRPMRAA